MLCMHVSEAMTLPFEAWMIFHWVCWQGLTPGYAPHFAVLVCAFAHEAICSLDLLLTLHLKRDMFTF